MKKYSISILLGIFLICDYISAESKTINLLFFHFEPRSYDLTESIIVDSIDQYIAKYGEHLYDPEALELRMREDYDFAYDQLAQKRVFALLDQFKEKIKQHEKYKDSDLSLKVHFILWDDALEFLQREAKNPTFDIVQIAQEFLGGVAQYGNVLSLDQFLNQFEPENIYNLNCLRSCRIENKGELLALPFWVSMRTLFIRKDMLEAIPELKAKADFSDWDAFEQTGRLLNSRIDSLRINGFPNLKRFWAINISDKDMNTFQNLTPVIFSYGGDILGKKLWWPEVAFNKEQALAGIKKFFSTAKSVGILEECTFGELLNNFHAGQYAVITCGTWEHAYWGGTIPDSSSCIEIKLPPAGPVGQSTLLWGCNLIILKHPQKKDYSLEFELNRYLSTNPEIQLEYLPSNARLSVLKSAPDSISRAEYYEWMNNSNLVKPYPNDKAMYTIINSLTQKYRLTSILLNVKGAEELSIDVWEIIENAIDATARDLNRQIIPGPIYGLFYSKINILVMLLVFSLLGFWLIRIVKRMRRLANEKVKIESDLTARLQLINREKSDLKEQQQNTMLELHKNQETIRSLSTKLNRVTQEFERLKLQSNLEKIEQYSSQILALTAKNKSLQAEIDRTSRNITANEKIVLELESELEDIKNPEIYIDFRMKTIHKKNGSEFILSSAARQYKNDVFRYLEFIVRHKLNRIHLLVFGYIDILFFRNALSSSSVRKYNYSGKFAKVKSGINRTFKNNIGKDLIIQDDTILYVYYKNPENIYQIGSKNKDFYIKLKEITSNDHPQVLAFPAYDSFDYYAVNDKIILHSNVQESEALLKQSGECRDREKKIQILEQSLTIDPYNYNALFFLLKYKPFDYYSEAEEAVKKIEARISRLESFLSFDVKYNRNITNFSNIKKEYKELYAWTYVNKNKSKEMEKIGIASFQLITDHEKQRLCSLLDEHVKQRDRFQFFLQNVERLKQMAKLFKSYDVSNSIQGKIQRYSSSFDLFKNWDETGKVEDIKGKFINFLFRRINTVSDSRIDNALIAIILDFVNWEHKNGPAANLLPPQEIDTFIGENSLNDRERNALKQYFL